MKPLPETLRPQQSTEFIGQGHLWSENSALRKLVTQDRLFSGIFWGPAGTGKTSLARIIGGIAHHPIEELSAVSCGVKEIRSVLELSQQRLSQQLPAVLLFMDELHRLNKNQQDVLLPALEAGIIRFIGATTENPSFTVNHAILSRSLVFPFRKLTDKDLQIILKKAHQQHAKAQMTIADEVIERIAQAGNGDARQALNLFDALLYSLPDEITHLGLQQLEQLPMQAQLNYDRKGDQHYDVISAFIKSLRASQPDAALHYLARMLVSGEDPGFIARRMVIFASEDIGNANPTAAILATSCAQGVAMIGMPEARILLAQATTYLAASPKSNRSYTAINQAWADVEKWGSIEVPLHLRNAPTQLMKDIGYGKNYAYPHDDPKAAQRLEYLPEKLRDVSYYQPSDHGFEGQFKASLERLKNKL